eukprot:COSAG01_NODE_13_length_41723_cov_145.394556_63_plen_279_part_00
MHGAAIGVLSLEEFRRGLEQLGVQLSTAEFQKLLGVVDADGDAVIDYQEFISIACDEVASPAPTPVAAAAAAATARSSRSRSHSRSRSRDSSGGSPRGRRRRRGCAKIDYLWRTSSPPALCPWDRRTVQPRLAGALCDLDGWASSRSRYDDDDSDDDDDDEDEDDDEFIDHTSAGNLERLGRMPLHDRPASAPPLSSPTQRYRAIADWPSIRRYSPRSGLGPTCACSCLVASAKVVMGGGELQLFGPCLTLLLLGVISQLPPRGARVICSFAVATSSS